ncbi:hypothetical protein [Pantoea cypripedii]|uniref:DUF2116 family Zn-ribbon domain-containing protein n=1 Tax=Pantoea cypripedii TaxID=55209 RepID=A0A6B9GD16_PANCY|nr:hypothetical protein [Pantoea cypripedii]QGY31319.1 hypothetical protein CUN67_13075 [Pantoea cypripedii]
MLDEAAEREQQMIAVALANRKRPEMKFTGRCYYCGEVIPKGNFCDEGCCHDYERLERANRHRRVA